MAKGENRFDVMFKDPVLFHPDGYVISAERYTREEAALIISSYLEGEVLPKDLHEERIRFCFPTPEPFDHFEAGKPAWFVTNDTRKGSKKVWSYYGI